MKLRLLSATLALLISNHCFAQADLSSVLESNDATSAEPAVEDVPPPEPVPVPDAAPRVGRTPRGEVRAHGFGISMLAMDSGVKVMGVVVGSRAQAAGIRPNDMIVTVNGEAVGDGRVLLAEGVESVGVLRNGAVQELQVPADASPGAARRTVTNYSVPRTTVSTPQRYYSAPYPYPPRTYSYRPIAPYGYSSYYRAYGGPRVNIGIGVGPGGFRGAYPVYGRFGGSPYGFGRGRGYYYGRGGGVGISVGGIGIRF